jgi:hypothetical protein
MKREVKSVILSILIGILVFLVGNGKLIGQQAAPADKSASDKVQKTGLVWDWMNDFENCEDWRAIATCPLGETKTRKLEGRPRIVNDDGSVSVVPTKDLGLEGGEDKGTDENGFDHEVKYVLGVRTYFMDRGFDRVEVFPPNEYVIRGKAKEIRVWVLGRKFRHTLYVKLRDYTGNLHKLKMGRLDFWGWKEMSVVVPGWLPQSTRYALLDKNLQFVSFFVESDTYEVPGTFYFYLDNFRIRTDLSEFTGDTTIKDNW